MRGFAFRTGLAFDWDETAHRIERLGTGDQVVLERLSDGQTVLSSQQELLAAFGAGRLRMPGTDAAPPGEVYHRRPLADLPNHIQSKVCRSMAYLDAVHEAWPIPLTKYHLSPLIAEVAKRINDPHPPSAVTIYRWHRAHRPHEDARALIPRFDRRGGAGTRQSDRVRELFGEAAEEAFQASPSATIKSIFTRLEGKIRAENVSRLPGDPLRLPSLRTVYRLFGHLEAYDQTRLTEGRHVADRRYRVVKAGPVVDGILQRVEVDHTPLDLFLIDEITGLPFGRPVLTLFIDVYSRFPVGYYLSFGGTSAAAVVGGLRHAILPKALVKEVIPDLPVEHTWPCYGLIASLVVDNGLEFYSTSLDSVAMDLGIRIQYCPKRQPWFKGTIERFLKTINYFLTHQLPGTSLARLGCVHN